jgi:hypothetical protein
MKAAGYCMNIRMYYQTVGTAVAQWLRYCATNCIGDCGSTVVRVMRYSGGTR